VLMDPRFVQAGPTDQIISTTNLSRMYGIPVDVERVKGRLVILPLEETRAEAPTDA